VFPSGVFLKGTGALQEQISNTMLALGAVPDLFPQAGQQASSSRARRTGHWRSLRV
jgi:hypothetical protein